MKKNTLKCLVILSVLVCNNAVMAQNNWEKIFPNAEAVYTNLSCDVTIKSEEGKWIATSNFSEDLLYLTDNSLKMMSRGHIYHSSFDELKKWDAYVKVSERKKVKASNASTTSSMQDYIFYDDVKSTSFDYAGAVIGATRHMDYQLQHNDVYLLSPHYFERYFPVATSELNITFPSDVKLKYIIKGLNADKVTFSESKKRDKTTYTFKVSNLEASVPYADAPDNSYYATHIIYYIEQLKENGEWKNFLASAEDLYKHSYGFVKNINQNISSELKQIADSLTRNISSNGDKAKAIYKWVQSNIKYVAFEDGLEGFVPREASLVCSRRFGDCKDMTSILTAMLKHVKIPAYFTWIGTRSIPYDYTEVPLPIVDNHMICTIKPESNYVFLDGTDPGCIFGFPPHAIQGKQAMVGIDENEFKLLRVPVIPKEENNYLDSTFIEWNDKELTGRIKVYMTGYPASDMQTTLNFKNEKEGEEYLKQRFTRGSNKIKFSNWKIDQNPDHNEVLVTADFNLPDYARKLSDEIFLNLNLFKWYEHQEIDFPKRKMPIEHSFLNHSTFTTVIKFPSGFKASYVPKSETFKNDVWGFIMQYETKNNAVYLTQEFDTDQLMLYPNQFEAWNKVLQHLFPHYKQTVAFSKN